MSPTRHSEAACWLRSATYPITINLDRNEVNVGLMARELPSTSLSLDSSYAALCNGRGYESL